MKLVHESIDSPERKEICRISLFVHHNRKRNMASNSIIGSLRRKIASCEAQLADLRQQLTEAEHIQKQQERTHTSASTDPLTHDMSYGLHDDFRAEVYAALSHNENEQPATRQWPLEPSEYKRYGRQLIMPEIGLQGRPPII